MEKLDNHFICKLIDGNFDAFKELYNLYYRQGLLFLTSIIKDKEEAENMVQDVFIKIWLRREQINPELNFNSYLFTCLRNMAFDHLKKVEKSHQMKQQFMQMMEDNNNADSEAEDTRITLLKTAMDHLPEKRKMIVKLNIEEGKSYQEIAEIMRISKNTVKNQLVKAKQFLRRRADFGVSVN
jgi:RNA polymerase sigma-70 factor (family 1)